ncbi:MAG: hypothetical protein K0U98_11175 [Deltaproteobacteria bacterium]|nr:hypothetical protein [Deltaproteobacteria bacterium]
MKADHRRLGLALGTMLVVGPLVIGASKAASAPIDIHRQVWLRTSDSQARDSQGFCGPNEVCKELCVLMGTEESPTGTFSCFPGDS